MDHIQGHLLLPEETAATCTSAPTPSFEHPADATAAGYEESYLAFLDLSRTVEGHYRAYRQMHRGLAHSVRGLEVLDTDAHDFAREIVRGLCRTASESFGFAGRSITIDSDEVLERFSVPRRKSSDDDDFAANARTFSPKAVWAYLKERFAISGKDQALREAAEVLVRELPFGRWSKDRITRSAGWCVFACCLYASKKESYSSGSGDYQLNWDVDRRLSSVAQAFGAFLAWNAGVEEIPSAFERDLNALLRWIAVENRTFNSREKKPIGPLVLQFFKSELHYRVPETLAARLNLFLAQFAGESMHEKTKEC